ncbi:MAG: DUF2461 domain-containing protein [Raineya sp.]|jgi:uncharacterized protein (TIGR02453 family)|nr:DUF2461 domain-containing protein [Raineya sp.]
MIQATTFDFLKNLKKNNNKEWFDKNREMYEKAKQNFLEFTETLIDGISEFDEHIYHAHLDAKSCVSRINRDIRFSKDKTPYKSNFFAIINQGGKKSPLAGYYFQLEPNESFLGGGVYMSESSVLQKIRKEIDYHFDDFQEIVESESFTKVFTDGIKSSSILARPPKGYEADNPAIEYLKRKDFYTLKYLTDKDLQNKKSINSILEGFFAVKPVIDFINRAFK